MIRIFTLFWVNKFLLETIAPAEYSLYPLLLSIMLAAEVFAKIFTGGIARFVVEMDTPEKAHGVSRVVSSMLPFIAVISVLLLLTGGLAVSNIESFLNIEPALVSDAQLMLSMQIVTLCTVILCTPFSCGLYVRHRFVAINLIELAGEAGRITIMAGLLLAVSAEVKWVVFANSIVTLAVALTMVRMSVKEMPDLKFRRSHIDLAYSSRIVRFGSWTATSSITEIVQRTLPIFILNHYSTPVAVASLHIARLVDFNIRKISRAATIPIEPLLTRLHTQSGMEGMEAIYYRGGKYQLWFVLAPIGPLVVFSLELINLYAGPTYTEAAYAMVCLLAQFPFLYASAMFYRIAVASEQVSVYFQLELVATLVMAVAIVGVAVLYEASSITVAFTIAATNILFHVFLIWHQGIKLVSGSFRLFLVRTLLPGMTPLMAAIGFSLAYKTLSPVMTWFDLMIPTFAAIGVYLIVLLTVCTDSFDRTQCLAAVQKAKRAFTRG
ncbi:MAG: hypothetical protein CME36_02925 [unclassified Hahellaceae]|nr:hypothetical protein [Hahellaceae bacterium]